MGGYDTRDRLGALRNSIERDKQIPDYIKDLKLMIVNKTSLFAINIANETVGNIELAYWREHSDFKKQAKEIEQLRKILKEIGDRCHKHTAEINGIDVFTQGIWDLAREVPKKD